MLPVGELGCLWRGFLSPGMVLVGGRLVGVSSAIGSGETSDEQAVASKKMEISICTDSKRGMKYVKNFDISTVVRYLLKR